MVAAEGWPFFRTKEREAIGEIASFDNCVVAAGGGAVLDDANVRHLKASGAVVLLEADVETILKRMGSDDKTAGQRPSLTGKGHEAEIEEVLKYRRPFYQTAMDFSVDTASRGIEEVVEEIVRRINMPNIIKTKEES
jgi:shikimate kinase